MTKETAKITEWWPKRQKARLNKWQVLKQLQVRPMQTLTAIAIVVCCITGLALANHANYISPTDSHRYVIDNLGVTFIVLEAAFAYILKRLQHGVYWFNWLQMHKPKLDERQQNVRQQVFESAYLLSLAILLYAVGYAATPILWATSAPGNYDLLSRVTWATGILTITMPSILAAWRKDS